MLQRAWSRDSVAIGFHIVTCQNQNLFVVALSHELFQWGTLSNNLKIRNSFAPYRGRNPQNRENGVSESKNPISHHPRKGRSELKNPHVYTEHYKEKRGVSDSEPPFWGGGKWGFFDSETLFSQNRISAPVRGKRIPNLRSNLDWSYDFSEVAELLCKVTSSKWPYRRFWGMRRTPLTSRA